MVKREWSRLDPLGDKTEQKANVWFEAERWIPDGTNGATFTDATGTAGQFQYNSLYFNGAADAIAHLLFQLPRDYRADAKMELWGYTLTTAATAVAWAARFRAFQDTTATVLGYTGNYLETQRLASKSPANTLRIATLDLTQTTSASTISLEPNSLCSLQLIRNVSEDGNANRFYFIGSRLTYTAGG